MSIAVLPEQQLKYLSRRGSDITDLKMSLETQDYSKLIMIGHRLKGSGQTFGFPLISSLGRSIEEAARLENVAALKGLILDLETAVEKYLAELPQSV